MKTNVLTTIAALGLAASVSAQLAEKKGLTLEGARRVIAAAAAHAAAHDAPGGAIAVVDEGGNLLAFERLDGTFAASANISIGKARTAALFGKPTKAFEDAINGGRIAMAAMHENFTPLQGGVPILVGGKAVGAVGVSGASSAQQDEEIAMAGAQAISAAAISGNPARAAQADVVAVPAPAGAPRRP